MNNAKLHWLLREVKDRKGRPKWTVGRIAAAIGSGRAHVTQVLNNEPGRGGHTRGKLVLFFQREFKTWREIVGCLGWEANVQPPTSNVQCLKCEGCEGVKVPRETLHVEQMGAGNRLLTSAATATSAVMEEGWSI